jgi:hypothetical protein
MTVRQAKVQESVSHTAILCEVSARVKVRVSFGAVRVA